MKFKLDAEQEKELGKFLLDLSKLIFGGIILSSILKDGENYKLIVILLSVILIFVLLIFGLILMKKKNKHD